MLAARNPVGVAASVAILALSTATGARAESLALQPDRALDLGRARPPAESTVPAMAPLALRLSRDIADDADPPLALPAGAIGLAPALAQAPAGTGAVPEAPASPGLPDDGSPIRWGLAPVRWRGLLATDVRYLKSDGQPKRLQFVDSTQVDASSYIWQPWFAQVSGGAGLLMTRERSDGAPLDRSSGRSMVLTGNGSLSVFPASRFPFLATFNTSDSRLADQYFGQDYSQRRWGVRQSYRNEPGDANYSASYDASTLTSGTFGRDTVGVLNANLNQRHGAHTIDAGANHTRNTRGNSGELSNFLRGFARHGVSLQEGLLSADTTVSYAESDLRLASNGGLVQSKTDILQANSFLSWRPEQDHPLYVTGGARYFQNSATGFTGAAQARSATAFASALYNATRQLTLSGSASATQASSAGVDTTVTTQTAGATYIPDARQFGGFAWGSSLGTTLSNATNTQSGNRFALGGQANHHLQRTFPIGERAALSVLGAQGYSVTNDSVAGGLQTLTHNASASLRVTAGEALSGFASLGAGDSRTRGYNASDFQLLNLQVSGQAQFGRYDSLVANLTVQGTRQQTPQQAANGFNVTTNGSATYQHLQFAGVPRLRYLAIFTRNDQQLNTRLQGDLSAPRELLGASLEQRLEYRVGRVELRVTARVGEIDGKKNALLFFRLARQIGNP